MKALRSSHRKFLTVFLFVYFGLLFISFTNLNMKESSDTDIKRMSSSNDIGGKELYYSLLNPSDSNSLPDDLSSFKYLPLGASRQSAIIYDPSHPKPFVNSEDVHSVSHRKPKRKEKMPHLRSLEKNQNERPGKAAGKEQDENNRHFVEQNKQTDTISPTRASYMAGPGDEQQILDDTEQAKAWLFEMEKDFPGLKNFHPDPLVEPFGDVEFSTADNDGDFTSLGREAYVYSAYLDDRRRDDIGVYVRVIALLSQKSATASMYSHREGEDASSGERCILYEMCENHGKFYGGYIFSCPVHSSHSKNSPISSLSFAPRVNNTETVTNNSINISSILLSLGKFAPQIKIPILKVNPVPYKVHFLDSYPSKNILDHNWHHETRTSIDAAGIQTGQFVPPSETLDFRKESSLQNTASYPMSFAICVSPLFGDISPSKLVEFIELSHLFGADHFYMYNFSIPDSVSRVLEHYKSLGLVTVLQFKFPAGVRTSLIWYHGQLLANNDCLYRTMPHHDMVAFNDLDEFIVPRSASTKSWREAFSSLLTNDKSGFSFQSAFFDYGVPIRKTRDAQSRRSLDADLVTMTSIARTRRLSKVRTKVMLCPWRVFEVGIHHISKQNREEWLPLSVDPSLAMLHHYRPCVSNLGMRCDSWTLDTTVPDDFGDKLVPKVKQAMRQIFRGTG